MRVNFFNVDILPSGSNFKYPIINWVSFQLCVLYYTIVYDRRQMLKEGTDFILKIG
jgi:hypothetical protein